MMYLPDYHGIKTLFDSKYGHKALIINMATKHNLVFVDDLKKTFLSVVIDKMEIF